jgi:transposase
VEGRSQRAVAREFGLARKTVRKMLEYSAPPGYQRQKAVQRPKLGPWQAAIGAILEEDRSRPRKQRHTAKRIFERLREEHGYTGGYTIVKDYVRQSKLGARVVANPEVVPFLGSNFMPVQNLGSNRSVGNDAIPSSSRSSSSTSNRRVPRSADSEIGSTTLQRPLAPRTTMRRLQIPFGLVDQIGNRLETGRQGKRLSG